MASGAEGSLDIRRIPYYRKRGSGVSYYFNPHSNVSNEEFTAEKAAYLARLGVNQYTGEDYYPAHPSFPNAVPVLHLHQLVRSDVFQSQPPPVLELQRKLKSMSSLCRRHGIDFYFELWEPIIPECVGGVELYPKEAIGTVHRPWGGDKGGLQKTLCVSSPIVQAHYRDMIGKLAREYPDIKGVTFYNMDGSTWLCTPELCERCKAVCADSPPDQHNPWEPQAAFVSMLWEAAHAARPDFDFRFWPVHYSGEPSEKLCSAARFDSLDMGWNNSDRELRIPHNVKKPRLEFLAAQKNCEERKIPMFALAEINCLESLQRSMPFPFHACDTLNRYKSWGITHFNEWVGPFPAHNPINALAMREFLVNPDCDPEVCLKELATRQFGAAAGGLMYRAWEEIRGAFDAWEDYALCPLSGSQPYLGIGSLAGMPRAITPDISASYENDLAIRTKVELFRAPDYQRFRELPFLDSMEVMGRHLAQAAELASQAVARASDREFIELCLYRSPEASRPTRREYAELNHATIAMADLYCQQRVDIVRAVHLLNDRKRLAAIGDMAQVKTNEDGYCDLIRSDITLQKRFIELLLSFLEKRPCLTRAGMPEAEISGLLYATREKVDKLKAFLETSGRGFPGWDINREDSK